MIQLLFVERASLVSNAAEAGIPKETRDPNLMVSSTAAKPTFSDVASFGGNTHISALRKNIGRKAATVHTSRIYAFCKWVLLQPSMRVMSKHDGLRTAPKLGPFAICDVFGRDRPIV